MKKFVYITLMTSLASFNAYADHDLTKNEKQICKNVKTDACVKFCSLKKSDKLTESSPDHIALRNECQSDAVKYNESKNNN